MAASAETVLILTPVKNASRFLDSYFAGLGRLSHPAASISLGFLESDSDDYTDEQLRERLEALRSRYAGVGLWQKNFNFRIPAGFPRWTHAFHPRRKIFGEGAVTLFRALADEDWVLWLDVDVIDYPPDLIGRLLATGRDIVHPHCVKRYGGPTFDLNAWRDHGRLHMEDLRGGLIMCGWTPSAARCCWCAPISIATDWSSPAFPTARRIRRCVPRPAGVARRAGNRGLRRHGNGYGPPMLGHAQSRTPARARVTRSASTTYTTQIRLLACEFEIHTNSREVMALLSFVTQSAEQDVPVVERGRVTVTWTGDEFRFEGDGIEADIELSLPNVVDGRSTGVCTTAPSPRCPTTSASAPHAGHSGDAAF